MENYLMIAKKHFKIFVLDGNMFSLNIYEQQLINLGYLDISTFHTAQDCLSALSQGPDIIFLDHSINIATGVDILKKIKRINPHIYVIFIAGIEETEAVVTSLKNGAFDFIVKGDNDLRILDNVIVKVHRVKVLLEKNNILFKNSVVVNQAP